IYGRPQRDERDFHRTVMPAVDQVVKLPETLGTKLQPLMDSPPDKRDPVALDEAKKLIDELQTEEEAASRIVEQAGPYVMRPLEEARRTGAKYLAVQRQFLQQIERCLRNPDNDAVEKPTLALL